MLIKLFLSLRIFLIFGIIIFTQNTYSVNVGGNISGDNTWTLDNSPYIVTSNLNIPSGSTLNIDPGVMIKVNANRTITVRGTILANGTDSNKIVFTSNESFPIPGNWRGIYFYSSTSNESILDNVEVKYGGYSSSRGGITLYGSDAIIKNSYIHDNIGRGIYVYNKSPVIENNIISNNKEYRNRYGDGIYIRSGTPIIKGNTIKDNEKSGIYSTTLEYMLSPNLNNIVSSNPYGDCVSTTFTIISSSGTIDSSSCNLYLERGGSLASGKTIIFKAGSIIKVGVNRLLYIRGKLVTQGTSENKIIFTSVNDNSIGNTSIGTGTPAGGNWRGIFFYGAGSDDSTLNNAEIKYGGYSSSYGGVTFYRSNATIKNSYIHDNIGRGIYVYNESPIIENNIISNNKEYRNRYGDGIYIRSGTSLIKGNTIKDNEKSGIYSTNLEYMLYPNGNNIVSSNSYGNCVSSAFTIISSSGTIDSSSCDVYLPNGGRLASGKTITFDAGSVIKVGINRTVEVRGKLITNGITNKKVVFTTVNDNSVGNSNIGTGNPAPGNWRGIYFYSSGTNGSILDNTEIKYGGYSSSRGGVTLYSSNAIIKNSYIHNNIGRGIYVYNNSPVIENNIITNNKKYGTSYGDGIYIRSGTPVIKGNTINNNEKSGIYSTNLEYMLSPNGNNIVSSNSYGNCVSSAFTITSSSGIIDSSSCDIYLPNGGRLVSGKTISFDAGSIIKVGINRTIDVRGKLITNGTPNNKVIFTSVNDNFVGGSIGTGTPAPGNWRGIYFYSSGTSGSILNNSEVKYGGYSSSRGGITLHTSNIKIKNSYIHNNIGRGIYMYNSSPNILNNTISNNKKYGANYGDGIYIRSGSPVINSNILYKNAKYGIYKHSGSPQILYNLYYLNTIGPIRAYTLDENSIIGKDPLFEEGSIELQSLSPAINKGDPSLGNNSDSGDTYDIGGLEYVGYKGIKYGLNITGVGGRELNYEWSFIEDPTGGANEPTLSIYTGSIDTDGEITTSFTVEKLGVYKINLSVKNGSGIILGTGNNTFNITN